MTTPPTPPAGTPAARTGRDEAAAVCSAKGCTNDAAWVLAWNNPRVHHPDRLKTWAACDEHRESLAEFLAARSFLRQVVARSDWESDH